MASPSITLSPRYDPHAAEARWYPRWEAQGCFRPRVEPGRTPYVIVIPPPNVTGILHMGHALNNTIQDILIRWQRMAGRAALWIPGTDHAGIATQNVVERQLAHEGQRRQDLGREAFVARVWAWKQQYGSTIVQQLRRLGASCDWSRERFTMDAGLSAAVQEAFLRLWRDGLIYNWVYVVNWCPRCQTALSDEEVTHREIQGHLYHIRYPVVGSTAALTIATTRPETMLGDTAVAVHPEDPRYQRLVGQSVALPLAGRTIPIVATDRVDRAFGTGALKVTPAHDPVDYLIWQEHPEIGAVVAMRPDATMSEAAGRYAGLDRFTCRKQIVEDLAGQGLLVKVEEHRHAVGHCYRCQMVIEPYLSRQWFVQMKPLARLGLEAVDRDGLTFYPDRWTKVYRDWLEGIRDWCISRQIWWGHRIPVWYCAGAECRTSRGHFGASKITRDSPPREFGFQVSVSQPTHPCPCCRTMAWEQDPDVLDTWFSSWLWPFSTLGWPDQTEDLRAYYPTSALVTAPEILFFWVARMVMAGKYFLQRIPFRDVAIHGTVRDVTGKKMSKSLGNAIDPLEIIDRYGADALRYCLVTVSGIGQDIYLSKEQFEPPRNFANKLWNAGRFLCSALPPGIALDTESPLPRLRGPSDAPPLAAMDWWILTRFDRAAEVVTASLAGYQLHEAARQLYDFLWHEFCDWYLELIKPRLPKADGAPAARTALWVFERSLRLLHPIMPFVTEELWQALKARGFLGGPLPPTLMLASWPTSDPARRDPRAEEELRRFIEIVTALRNIRAELRVPVARPIRVLIGASPDVATRLTPYLGDLQRMVRASHVTITPSVARPDDSAVAHVRDADLVVPLAGIVDLAVERQRIQRRVEELQHLVQGKRGRLRDDAFRAKAPAAVVAQEEAGLRTLEAELAKWSASLAHLT